MHLCCCVNLEFRIFPRGRDPPWFYAILFTVHFLNHALRLTCGKDILRHVKDAAVEGPESLRSNIAIDRALQQLKIC